jgi:RNA polymerase-binding transcription factor DksA
MPKPTKAEVNKYRKLLEARLAVLRGDVGSMRDEALRASEQDASVDHLGDHGTDNYDQGFLLGLIENEEETIQLIEEALERLDGGGDWPFGACPLCVEEADDGRLKKTEVWIPKARLEYLPEARYCVRHKEEEERRESA